jgi:sigma-54-specific transcriptional regulator
LVHHFIEIYQQRLNLEKAGVTAAAEDALQRYSWPGNIRELENIVHVGLIMSRNGLIDVGDLRVAATDMGDAAASRCVADGRDAATTGLSRELHGLLKTEHGDVYELVQRLLVATAFEHCSGNQVRTAKRLGVSRNVMRTQLKRYGLLGNTEPFEGSVCGAAPQ